ncbi:MAG TPA: polymer-forming cytoskeletal protein [Burkholderiales bacterium]|nr:polymer-forming cytoskeletal protein [Burkholderiales bacterium]
MHFLSSPQHSHGKPLHRCFAFLAAGFFLIVAAPASSQQTYDRDNAAVTTSSSGNLYVAGSTVRLESDVPGDLFAAGGNVTVNKLVGEDAVIAGGEVNVDAPVGEDLRVAAGNVAVGGQIGGDAAIAGGKVNITRDAKIAGDAWLAGGEVRVNGAIGKELRVYGDEIVVAGEVTGDARLRGRRIAIAPGAVINGELQYMSPNDIVISPDARIAGKILREPEPDRWITKEQRHGISIFLSVVWLVGLIAAGALLLLLFPNLTRRTESNMRAAPLKSLGLGSAILFAAPPIIILLFVSVIGIPVALVLLATYAILLLIGYLTTAAFIGDRIARLARKSAELTTGWRIASMALALILLTLVGAIPFLGGFIILIALLFGLDAFVLQLFQRYRSEGGVPDAS